MCGRSTSKITQEILIPAGMERPEADAIAAPAEARARRLATAGRTPALTKSKKSVDRVLGDEVARRSGVGRS